MYQIEKVMELLENLQTKRNELVKNAKNPNEFESRKMFSKKQYEEWFSLCEQEKGIIDTVLALGIFLDVQEMYQVLSERSKRKEN